MEFYYGHSGIQLKIFDLNWLKLQHFQLTFHNQNSTKYKQKKTRGKVSKISVGRSTKITSNSNRVYLLKTILFKDLYVFIYNIMKLTNYLLNYLLKIQYLAMNSYLYV